MIKTSHILIALLSTFIAAAHAETANQPVSQGAASVDKNLKRDPDNKGLQRASEQLKENEAKVAEKRAEAGKTSDDAKDKKESKKEAKHERKEAKRERKERRDHGKMERPEKPKHPGK